MVSLHRSHYEEILDSEGWRLDWTSTRTLHIRDVDPLTPDSVPGSRRMELPCPPLPAAHPHTLGPWPASLDQAAGAAARRVGGGG